MQNQTPPQSNLNLVFSKFFGTIIPAKVGDEELTEDQKAFLDEIYTEQAFTDADGLWLDDLYAMTQEDDME